MNPTKQGICVKVKKAKLKSMCG